MKIDFLISTVNNNVFNNNPELLANLSNYIIINQILDKNIIPQNHPNCYSYHEKGLTRSRNRAIELSRADICFLCDDDLAISANAEKTIEKVFTENPDADIILFNTATPAGKILTAYRGKPFSMVRTLLSAKSCMIAFRRSIILNKELRFDEEFGLNSDYQTGAENIFLFDCRRKGLSINTDTNVITIHPEDTSGNNFTRDQQIFDKGVVLARIFGISGIFIVIMSTFKFYPFYKHTYSPYKFFMIIIRGFYHYLCISKSRKS